MLEGQELELKYEIFKNKFEAGKKLGRIKRISRIIIIILIMLNITSIIFFYNRDIGFILSGKSENFEYQESMIIKTNNYYYFTFGNIKENQNNVKSIEKITLLSDDKLIISSTNKLSGIQKEKIGYNELFTKEKFKNINNWYYKIEYTDKNNQKQEEILKLEARRIEK